MQAFKIFSPILCAAQHQFLTKSMVFWMPFSFCAANWWSLFDAEMIGFELRLVLPRDTDGRRLAAVDDFWLSLLLTFDLLPVREGPTETSETSSDRFVPGRVERGRARPLTGRSSILLWKENYSMFIIYSTWILHSMCVVSAHSLAIIVCQKVLRNNRQFGNIYIRSDLLSNVVSSLLFKWKIK